MGKIGDTADRVEEVMMRVNMMVTILAINPDNFFKSTFLILEKKNIKFRVG